MTNKGNGNIEEKRWKRDGGNVCNKWKDVESQKLTGKTRWPRGKAVAQRPIDDAACALHKKWLPRFMVAAGNPVC